MTTAPKTPTHRTCRTESAPDTDKIFKILGSISKDYIHDLANIVAKDHPDFQISASLDSPADENYGFEMSLEVRHPERGDVVQVRFVKDAPDVGTCVQVSSAYSTRERMRNYAMVFGETIAEGYEQAALDLKTSIETQISRMSTVHHAATEDTFRNLVRYVAEGRSDEIQTRMNASSDAFEFFIGHQSGECVRDGVACNADDVSISVRHKSGMLVESMSISQFVSVVDGHLRTTFQLNSAQNEHGHIFVLPAGPQFTNAILNTIEDAVSRQVRQDIEDDERLDDVCDRAIIASV